MSRSRNDRSIFLTLVFLLLYTECPTSLAYAEVDSPCIHFVVEVPLTITNGPEEYVVKDVMRRKWLKATNLDGMLYDAVKSVNSQTQFVGLGKPGAGEIM